MAGKRFSAAQIIIKLREAEVGLAQGLELPRFGGHLRIWEKGVHNGKESILIPA